MSNKAFQLYNTLLLLILIAIVMSFAIHLMAQTVMPKFAFEHGGTLIFTDETSQTTNLMTADSIGYLAWSIDGEQLAVIRHTRIPQSNDIRELGIISFASNPIETHILQTQHLATGFNISWTQDNRLLFATEELINDPETGFAVHISLYATRFNEIPVLLETFTFGGECGGGSSIPSDWRYYRELSGFGGFLTLAETNEGILYSRNCSATDLALLDEDTGISRAVATNFTKTVVSPDGSRVAGILLDYSVQPMQRQLAVYDVSTANFQIVPTEAEPDLVAWNQDGSALYYSIRTYHSNLVDNLSSNQRTQLARIVGYEMNDIPANFVTVNHVILESHETSTVYTAEAYAITRMIETPNALYISRVPNPNLWLDQLLADEINYQDELANLEAVHAEVFAIARIDTSFGEAYFLGQFDLFTPHFPIHD